ncbi:MAG: alpha-amylase family glycosyl hydrolase [Candidatus Izemoplasma sp.]|nr:alpha-amylase family glycosyl hydrolase [Candidatus Izemoplasma sp.]
MKKILTLLGILLLSLTLAACQQTTDPKDNDNNDDDMSWKKEYDMVDTSPHFEENVDVCYQIFPISYADSNNDGYGDLQGITNNLDYLSETLNVDCLWLNPIHPSNTYHKYDVIDYYAIDDRLGTLDDYETLLEEAETRGIKVLMDFVVNHTADDHPWFINSRSSKESDYRDWYIWNDLSDKAAYPSQDGWYFDNGEYYYASFWDQMPELNLDNPEVREELKSIATFWLDKGVDGFRIDAAKHLYDLNEYPRGTNLLEENTGFFKELNAHIKSINPDSFIVGEIWSESSSYIGNFYEGMDSTFNFPLSEAIIDGLLTGTATPITDVMVDLDAEYSETRETYIDSIFLTNHDQNRIIDQLNGNLEKAQLAAAINFTLPGISWVYYGEELGMTGVKPDESIRQPFIWGEDDPRNVQGQSGGIADWNPYNAALDGVIKQLANTSSMLNHYQTLITLKQTNQALAHGDFMMVNNDHSRLLAYLMVADNQTLLIIHNMSQLEQSVSHTLSTHTVLYGSDTINLTDSMLTLDPLESVVIEIDETDVTLTE